VSRRTSLVDEGHLNQQQHKQIILTAVSQHRNATQFTYPPLHHAGLSTLHITNDHTLDKVIVHEEYSQCVCATCGITANIQVE